MDWNRKGTSSIVDTHDTTGGNIYAAYVASPNLNACPVMRRSAGSLWRILWRSSAASMIRFNAIGGFTALRRILTRRPIHVFLFPVPSPHSNSLERSIMKSIHRAFLLAASLAAACFSSTTWAQAYPSKPITIVVAYPAGGDTDLLARIFAEKLQPRLGQSVVVENRPGATGVIGSSYVSKAPADGYTLLLTPGSLPYVPMVLKTGGGYDALNGFTPIIQAGNVPLFLVTGANSGFKSFKDVVEAAKTRPVSYATAGLGSIHHILGEVVNKATGVRFEHVPYKGVAPAINDVLGGHIPLTYPAASWWLWRLRAANAHRSSPASRL